MVAHFPQGLFTGANFKDAAAILKHWRLCVHNVLLSIWKKNTKVETAQIRGWSSRALTIVISFIKWHLFTDETCKQTVQVFPKGPLVVCLFIVNQSEEEMQYQFVYLGLGLYNCLNWWIWHLQSCGLDLWGSKGLFLITDFLLIFPCGHTTKLHVWDVVCNM